MKCKQWKIRRREKSIFKSTAGRNSSTVSKKNPEKREKNWLRFKWNGLLFIFILNVFHRRLTQQNYEHPKKNHRRSAKNWIRCEFGDGVIVEKKYVSFQCFIHCYLHSIETIFIFVPAGNHLSERMTSQRLTKSLSLSLFRTLN